MENRGRTLSVDFANAVGRTVKAQPLTAIDYGQILEIHGLPLPPSFECHFSKNGSTAYKSIGTTTDGVGTVPFIDEQTLSGGIITAYIYLHETADDGETEYRIIIPVESRPGVTPAEPTPVQQDVIAQAISALNNAVTTTNANVAITEANKNASAQSAEEAEADANRADTAWNGAVIAQNSAQASADVASTKATEASQSASTAHSEAQYAHSYAESAHTDAQSAGQSATSAQASATSAQRSASLAQQYTATATAKASEAMQSAQSASQSAQTASASATDAQQSATQANTYATSASASAQSATASEASASASATSAQESAESAQASADRAEQEADRWYEFLPVDTATGSLAHITDGAKDVPVKSLSVALEPIQSGSGDPSPDNVRPITGHTQVVVNRTGKNLFDGAVIAGYIGANGEIGGQGSASFCHSKLIPVQGGESYIWSGNNGYPQNVKRLQCYDANRQWLSNPYYAQINTSVPYAIGGVLPADARYVALSFAREDTNVQFELSATATSYEPYSGQSITIPLGETVYGGTLDVVNGVLTVDRRLTTIGNELGSKVSGSNYATFQITPSTANKAKVANAEVLCVSSEYKAESFNSAPSTGDNHVFSSGGNIRIKDTANAGLTFAEYKALKANVQLCYIIANPITVPLTANQMTTLLGINNVWSDSGDVTVDYRADVQLYIQKMIANALNA